jgi:nucleoside-diphosphate-sugar epimerase
MRVFVTGASGWIGSAVVPELLGAGHQVVGLARSDKSAAALASAGAEVERGDLDDFDVLQKAASSSDGVIHLAFKHDVAFETGDFAAAAAADRRAIEVMGDALAGSDRPLVIASGLLGVAPGRVATEEDGRDVDIDATGFEARHGNAEWVLRLADRGVRSSVVRLSPSCHGDGDNGFVPQLISIARQRGLAGYLGDGSSRWPFVHRLDAATLFRLAAEKAPAGSVLHGAGEEGVAIRDLTQVMGRHLGVPVGPVAAEKAGEHFGFLAGFIGLDSPASSARTRALVDWEPANVGILEDLDQGHYFQPPK